MTAIIRCTGKSLAPKKSKKGYKQMKRDMKIEITNFKPIKEIC